MGVGAPQDLVTKLPGTRGLQQLQAQAVGTVSGDVARTRLVSFSLVWGGSRVSLRSSHQTARDRGSASVTETQAAGTVSGDVARTRLVSFTLVWGGGWGSPGSGYQTARDIGSATVTGTSCRYCLRARLVSFTLVWGVG